MSSILSSSSLNLLVMYRRPTNASPGTMDGTPVGAEGSVQGSPPEDERGSDYRREFSKSSWAACIKRIYEIDLPECPWC